MEENQSKSSLSQTKVKTFLVKRRLPDDAKIPKNLSSLPGLPNLLISQASMSGSQFHKPNSSQTEARISKKLNLSQNFQSKGQITLKTSDLFNDPNNNEPPLTEINEHDISGEEEEHQNNHQVEGPQLEMEKEYITFLTKTDQVEFDNVTVNNNGSASIYYEWKRINSTRQSQNSIQDINEERFFCHHEQNVIKPGERIRFVFSFLSKVTGVFNEEWYLKCEPPTRDPLTNLKLSGQAHIVDDYKDWRISYDQELDKEFTLKAVNEVVGDILENVRTPTPPQPDLDDPEQCKVEFEELNLGERLWYTKESVNFFKSSHQEICSALNMKEEKIWNLDIQELQQMLYDVDEEEGKEFIERKLRLWTKLAKKTPLDRSSIFTFLRDMLNKVALSIPETSENLRKELDMWDIIWKEPTNIDPTVEELKFKADELAKSKAEWLKRAKKKKWNEEMEKELYDGYRKRLTDSVQKQILDQTLRLSEEGDLLRVEQLMIPSLKWDQFRRCRVNQFYWDLWMRKKTILDADIEGKRVAVKIHLQLSKGSESFKIEFERDLVREKEEQERNQEEEKKERERQLLENVKKKVKGKPQPVTKQKVQEQKLQDQPKKRDLKHIDQGCLQEALDIIRNLLERSAKLVVVIVSYDRPFGRQKATSSVKFFFEWLKLNLEQTVTFSESHIVDNFDEQVENQIWPDNSVLVLENIFFEPMETQTIIDDEGNVTYPDEPDIESETPFRKLLPYAPIYIIADKTNLFNNQLPTINHMNAEQTILGTNILRDIQTIAYNIQGMYNRNGIIIIGGALTAQKLLAIDTLVAHCSSIILLGNIGLQFFCTMFEVESDNVSETNRKVIKQLLDCLKYEMTEKAPEKLKRITHITKPPKPKAKLICPVDFIISRLPDTPYDPSNSDHLALILNNIQQYIPNQKEGTQKKIFDLKPDQILLDFGPETLNRVQDEILSAQRVIWIDSANLGLHNIEKTITVPDLQAMALLQKLKAEEAQREIERQEKLKEKKGVKGTKKQIKEEELPKLDLEIKTTKNINVPVFNETNRSIGKMLYQLQQNKKEQHERAQKSGQFQFHNFNSDCVITIVGSNLEEELNREDYQQLQNSDNVLEQGEQQNFQEGAGQNEEDIPEANEADRASQQSGQQQQEKQRINQVKQFLSDYFIQDQEFVLKVLAGHHIDCLKNIDEYPMKSNSEIDEEQYFEQDQSI